MRIHKHIIKLYTNPEASRHLLDIIILSAFLCSCSFFLSAQVPDTLVPWWPQKYKVTLDKEKNVLSLSTPYYFIEQNLAAGGNISKVKYANGKNENLLIGPVGVKINDADAKEEYSDMVDNHAQINYENFGNSVRVITNSNLHAKNGRSTAVSLKTIYEYHWGYIRIRRELLFPDSIMINRISIINFLLSPDLSDYGYRPGITEQSNTLPFAFNVIKWRKQRSGTHFDLPLYTSSVPEYMVFLNKGIEGIEWFTSDNAWQWDYQMAGKPGTGLCSVTGSYKPQGIDVAICPVYLPEGSVTVKGTYVFDYYIGLSILPGKANNEWLHAVINRNGGKWVTGDQIKEWKQSGVSTISYQDDGDTDHDGIFWKDGIYPPYSPQEMKKLDEVIDLCHQEGIKTATYFSIKEFHPSAQAYKDSGEIWSRRYNDKYDLKSTHSGTGDIYGVEMCLKSGWKNYLESYIDQTLSKHKFDGVYYDWNIPLYCNNPFHNGKKAIIRQNKNGIGVMNITPEGHRDIDELIEVMEWTRQRVGPGGLVIIHNTMAPMFVTENFANYVVSMEWGYGKLIKDVPPLTELPPEWNFADARPRGVIGYGTMHPDASAELKRKLALEALLTGVTPWPVMPEAIGIHQVLLPLGNLNQYKFSNWQNKSVKLNDTLCASAIYSKQDTAFLIIGNLGNKQSVVTVRLNASSLPFPIVNPGSVRIFDNSGGSETSKKIISTKGEKITIPPLGEVVLRITGKK
jgi:hypothetical protein